MVVSNRLLAATLAVSGFSLSQAHTLGDTNNLVGQNHRDSHQPSIDIAKSRAPKIFNAVHDSMRQWGASLHHNGMSCFLATVPEGVVFHHGNNQEKSPADPDWLAYEIEHAEGFARGGRGPGGGPPGKGPGHGGPPPGMGGPPPARLDDSTEAQHGLRRRHPHSEPSTSAEEESKGGWLHTYLTTRPMNYLYIDGMGGGKTDMGTLDSQDYLLRRKQKDGDDGGDGNRGPPMDERNRAVELCALSKEWGLDGVIRMEAGFEIIQCDFSNGLKQLQASQRPPPLEGGGRGPGRDGMFGSFEFVRGLAERYHDIGSSRTIIDYSSMVSAYFFPVNLTNPDPKRPDLSRLNRVPDAELDPIRLYLNNTIDARLGKPVRTIDWRDVTDIIVGRYADRVKFMTEKTKTVNAIAEELNFLLTAFIDYSGKEDKDLVTPAIERCANIYLHAVQPDTEADEFILAAIKTVTTEICTRLFETRKLVTADNDVDDDDDEADVLAQAKDELSSLMEYLSWARFKSCPPCDVDEVCFIPMWPMGSKAAYESPRCVNAENMDDGESYWGRGPGFGGPGHGRPGDGKDGKGGKGFRP